jgi:hypothetical protein
MSLGDAFGFFVGKGYTPEQSAGIVGNLFGESRLSPTAIGDGGKAYGLAQWHPDRQANFRNVMGVDIRNSTFDQQLAFVNWELNNTEKRAGDMLRQQNTIEGATYAFGKYYERPADLSKSIGQRTNAAKKAYEIGKGILGKAKSFLSGDSVGRDIANAIPGGSVVMGISDGLGLTGDCDWFCQFKNWITNSGFFPRLALAILAFIVIGAAVVFIGRGGAQKAIGQLTA